MSDDPQTCAWTYDKDMGYYDTACESGSNEFVPNMRHTFCPGCGKRIAIVPPVVEKEEDDA